MQLTMANLGTIPERLLFFIIITVISFLIFILFSWQETYLSTRQFKAQIEKSTLIILLTEKKVPNLAVNKHLSVPFSFH